MAEKDIISKTIESYNDVFADIVNGFLFDGKKVISPEELTPADVFSQYKTEGKIHGQDRDVSKYWHNAGIKIAFIGIENQSKPDKFMPIRIFSYDGASYRNQLNQKSSKGQKDKYYPVITLVLYFGKNDWNYGNSLYDCIEIPEELKPFVSNYKMNLYSMKDLTPQKIEKFNSDFKTVAEFFMNMNKETEKLSFSDRKLDHPNETLDLISVFSGDQRFTSAYNDMLEKNNEGGVTMCELYDKIEAKGIAKGIAEGEAKGRAEGRAEGEADGKFQMIKRLMSIGRSVKEIAEFFQTDESEIEGILAKE